MVFRERLTEETTSDPQVRQQSSLSRALPYPHTFLGSAAPYGLLQVADQETFERGYLERLERIGADRFRDEFSGIAAAHDARWAGVALFRKGRGAVSPQTPGRLVGLMFGDNFSRLIGMHGLTAKQASGLLGISAQTISSWLRGHSAPSFSVAVKVSQFFEVPADRLFTASFADLLDVLGDRERYERVENRIRRAGIKAVS